MTKNNKPLISIIIPVYNGSNYLQTAIESALAQTYPNCEILVINDGSDDNGASESIALSYGQRINYLTKSNGGVASALNFGIRQMQGEYFAWLSHDDWFEPEKISKQVEALSSTPDAIVSTGYSYYLEADKKVYKTFTCQDVTSLSSIFKQLYWPDMNISSMLIPRYVWEEVGGFDESCVTTQDYDFLFRVLKKGYRLEHIPESLMCMRHHQQQGTLTMNALHMEELETLYLKASALFLDELSNFSKEDLDMLIDSMQKRNLHESVRRLRAIRAYVALFYREATANKPIIWLYWENKPESATPLIITLSWETIYRHCAADFNIIILDEITTTLFLKNLNPLWRNFKQIAHRADYIRFMLLEQYGGIWLDSDKFIFQSLKPVLKKIEEHGFVCVAYKEDNSYIPIISFLGSLPHNSIVIGMLNNFNKYMNTKLVKNIQPAWDEIGGYPLKEIINSTKECYIYSINSFYPIPVYEEPQQLFLPPPADLENRLSAAFGQSLAFSVTGACINIFLGRSTLNKIALGLVYDRAFILTEPGKFFAHNRFIVWLYSNRIIKKLIKLLQKNSFLNRLLIKLKTKFITGVNN